MGDRIKVLDIAIRAIRLTFAGGAVEHDQEKIFVGSYRLVYDTYPHWCL